MKDDMDFLKPSPPPVQIVYETKPCEKCSGLNEQITKLKVEQMQLLSSLNSELLIKDKIIEKLKVEIENNLLHIKKL